MCHKSRSGVKAGVAACQFLSVDAGVAEALVRGLKVLARGWMELTCHPSPCIHTSTRGSGVFRACLRVRQFSRLCIFEVVAWLVAGSADRGDNSKDFGGRLACIGLDFGMTSFPRRSIVTRSIEIESCSPTMSIVTVDSVADTTRKGSSDFDSSFGGSLECLSNSAAAWPCQAVEFA